MEWQTVAIIAGLCVLGLMIVISMLARLYRKVGPNEALLVYGRGKTPSVVKGAGTHYLAADGKLPAAVAGADVV